MICKYYIYNIIKQKNNADVLYPERNISIFTSTPALQTNTRIDHVSLLQPTLTGFPHLSGCSPSHPPQTEWCHRRAPHREGSPPTPGSDAGCWWRCHCCFWCPGDRTEKRGEAKRLLMRQIQHYTEECRTNVTAERQRLLKGGITRDKLALTKRRNNQATFNAVYRGRQSHCYNTVYNTFLMQ